MSKPSDLSKTRGELRAGLRGALAQSMAPKQAGTPLKKSLPKRPGPDLAK